MSEAITRNAKQHYANAQNRDWIGSLRPVDTFLNYRHISLPKSAVDAASRLERNSAYFLSNYTFVLLITYFYAVVFNPMLFLSFMFTIFCLIGLEYIKPHSYVVGSYVITHSTRLFMVGVISVLIIGFTAGFQITVITLITCLVCFMHCIFHMGNSQYSPVSQKDDMDIDIDVEVGNINNVSSISALQPHHGMFNSTSNAATSKFNAIPAIENSHNQNHAHTHNQNTSNLTGTIGNANIGNKNTSNINNINNTINALAATAHMTSNMNNNNIANASPSQNVVSGRVFSSPSASSTSPMTTIAVHNTGSGSNSAVSSNHHSPVSMNQQLATDPEFAIYN